MQKGINEELIYRELNKINNDDLEDIAYNLALKKYEVLSKRENDKYINNKMQVLLNCIYFILTLCIYLNI